MPYTFDQAETAFKNDQISQLSNDPDGLRYLVMRTFSRKQYLLRLNNEFQLAVATRGRGLFEKVFNSRVTLEQMAATIRTIYTNERAIRRGAEDELLTQLYLLREFNWGGLFQNSLEKTIVNNYVKKIRSYDVLNQKIDNELQTSMRGYVLCSWYNHWTSIIIEDIFKDQPRVLPAVGLAKKIDFFVDNIPFDLKVTSLPEGYIKKRREVDFGLSPELTTLKQTARKLRINVGKLAENKLLEVLWVRLRDNRNEDAQAVIRELTSTRERILREAIENPVPLMKWLYENQGVRRFDSANRLFLLLVNTNDYFASWQLKRAKELLVDTITNHIANAPSPLGREVTFTWEGRDYDTRAEVIFVLPPTPRLAIVTPPNNDPSGLS